MILCNCIDVQVRHSGDRNLEVFIYSCSSVCASVDCLLYVVECLFSNNIGCSIVIKYISAVYSCSCLSCCCRDRMKSIVVRASML